MDVWLNNHFLKVDLTHHPIEQPFINECFRFQVYMIHLIYWTRIPKGGERATPHSQRGESAQVPGTGRIATFKKGLLGMFFV